MPDSGATWLLPRLVGAAKAAELALTTEPLTAADGERLGLVARVVPAADLQAEARALAVRLAAGAPLAIALTKEAIQRSWEATFDEQLELEAELQGRAGATADHAEGLAGVSRATAASLPRQLKAGGVQRCREPSVGSFRRDLARQRRPERAVRGRAVAFGSIAPRAAGGSDGHERPDVRPAGVVLGRDRFGFAD